MYETEKRMKPKKTRVGRCVCVCVTAGGIEWGVVCVRHLLNVFACAKQPFLLGGRYDSYPAETILCLPFFPIFVFGVSSRLLFWSCCCAVCVFCVFSLFLLFFSCFSLACNVARAERMPGDLADLGGGGSGRGSGGGSGVGWGVGGG